MKYSLCIPMYNESSIIAQTAETLSSYMENNFTNYEIIFSDDGSLDNSKDIVASLELPHVRIVSYEKNAGKGKAVRNAILNAQGEIVMFTDADLAFGTAVIKDVFEAMEKDPDAKMLVGSRAIHPAGYAGYTFIRKLASKTYLKVLKVFGGLKVSDSQCGCKAFRFPEGKEIFSQCLINGFAFDFEVILRMDQKKYKIIEHPVNIVNHRESKVNIIKDTFKMLKDIMRIKKQLRKESKAT